MASSGPSRGLMTGMTSAAGRWRSWIRRASSAHADEAINRAATNHACRPMGLIGDYPPRLVEMFLPVVVRQSGDVDFLAGRRRVHEAVVADVDTHVRAG